MFSSGREMTDNDDDSILTGLSVNIYPDILGHIIPDIAPKVIAIP